jgi:hypothetical protein
MKNLNDPIGNQTHDLPVCNAVPHATVPPRVPPSFTTWPNILCSPQSFFLQLPALYILPTLSSLRGLAGIARKPLEPKVFPGPPSPSKQKWCLLITSNPFNIVFVLSVCRLQMLTLIQLFHKLICRTDVNVFSDYVRLANTENVIINSPDLVSIPQYTLFVFQMSLTNTVILYI